MTVKQLIKDLQKLPQDSEVWLSDGTDYFYPVDSPAEELLVVRLNDGKGVKVFDNQEEIDEYVGDYGLEVLDGPRPVVFIGHYL